EGEHLDGGVVDLGEGGDGELPVGEGAGQQDRCHEQRGSDRAEDEEPGRVHELSLACAPLPCSRSATVLPSRSRSAPSTTTSSPAERPLSTDALSPSMTPTWTWRTWAV